MELILNVFTFVVWSNGLLQKFCKTKMWRKASELLSSRAPNKNRQDRSLLLLRWRCQGQRCHLTFLEFEWGLPLLPSPVQCTLCTYQNSGKNALTVRQCTMHTRLMQDNYADDNKMMFNVPKSCRQTSLLLLINLTFFDSFSLQNVFFSVFVR